MLKKGLVPIIFLLAASATTLAQEVEVNRYNVTARIDLAASAVDVRAAVSISNLGASAKPKLYFRLAKLAKVSAASVDGATAQFESADDRRATSLNQIVVTPPASLAAGATATVELSYRIEAPESNPLIHVYPGEVFLAPEAIWVPMPSTIYTLYGPTTAPATLAVSIPGVAGSFKAASTGASKSGSQSFVFEQPLNTLPILVAGEFDQPLSAEYGGVKVEVYTQPGITPVWSDARNGAAASIASRLSEETGHVVDFLTRTLGPPPAGATFRIISSTRAGNIVTPGALVLNEQVFRRDAVTASTIETLADAVAHLWLDGRVRIRGQEAKTAGDGSRGKPRSAAFIRDSLPRYLAALYIEDRFGKDAGRDAFTRMRWSYTPVAQSGRDAELAVQTVVLPNYTAAVLAKGPLVLRLLAASAGRDKLISSVRTVFAGAQTKIVTTEDFRAALVKDSADADRLFTQWVDTIIEPDIIVGAPLASDKPGVQRVNLRNLGTGDVRVQLVATTQSNKQLGSIVMVPSENITSTEIATAEKIVAIEIDPEKLIPQTNYDNDARDADFKNARTSSQTLFNESIAAFNKSQYAEAEQKLRQALDRDPNNPLIQAWLARTLAAESKFDEAATQAAAALKYQPPVGSATAWARITLGQAAMNRNRAADAVEQFRRALGDAEETPAQFAVRDALASAEKAAGSSPATDDSIRQYVSALDSAIKQPSSDKLFALVIRNNLKRFVQGITVSHPSAWTTEILRSDRIDANRVALDVKIAAKAEGRDQSGTAVLVLYRGPSGWMLEDVQLFNVK